MWSSRSNYANWASKSLVRRIRHSSPIQARCSLADIFEAVDVLAQRRETDFGAAGIDVVKVINRVRLPFSGTDAHALGSVALLPATGGILPGSRHAIVKVGVVIGPRFASGVEFFQLD